MRPARNSVCAGCAVSREAAPLGHFQPMPGIQPATGSRLACPTSAINPAAGMGLPNGQPWP